jgi:hypothetical protein
MRTFDTTPGLDVDRLKTAFRKTDPEWRVYIAQLEARLARIPNQGRR